MIELAIEKMRSADQGKMGEGLGKIAELSTPAVKLLGEETQMVGVAQALFHLQLSVLEATGARQTFDIPEHARGEGAIGTPETIA